MFDNRSKYGQNAGPQWIKIPISNKEGRSRHVRIYAFAKELGLDRKQLLEICKKANINIKGKGSALASLEDDEIAIVKGFMSGGEVEKTEPKPDVAAPMRPVRPEDIDDTLKMLGRTLKSMKPEDAIEQFCKQIGRFDPNVREVVIVFDTSFLMLKPGHQMWDNSKLGDAGAFSWVEEFPKVQFRPIVPIEVQKEILGHFDTEKDDLARVARGRMGHLMNYANFEQPSLEEFEPHKSTSVLGADSKVDRQLISFCKSLDMTDTGVVFLATNDGGILVDLKELQRDQLRQVHILQKDADWLAIANALLRIGWADEFLRLISGK